MEDKETKKTMDAARNTAVVTAAANMCLLFKILFLFFINLYEFFKISMKLSKILVISMKLSKFSVISMKLSCFIVCL